MKNPIIAYIIFFGLMLMLVISAVCMMKQARAQVDNQITAPTATAPSDKPVEKTYLGEFTVSAYCACEKCCGKWSNPDNPITASGAAAIDGITVGADWATIPQGTEIEIDSIGARRVQDKPARWIVKRYKGKVIDLYMTDHKSALNFGVKKLKVWEVKQ